MKSGTMVFLILFSCDVAANVLNVEGRQLLVVDNKPMLVFGGTSWNVVERSKECLIRLWDPSDNTISVIAERSLAVSLITVNQRGQIAFRSWGPHSLEVIDHRGAQVGKLPLSEFMQRVEWSPDGRKIAYITGEGTEGEDFTFHDGKTWIYSLDDDAAEQVFDGGYELHWAAFDGNIYIYDNALQPPVQRYNPSTKTTEPTEFKHVNFSPGGAWYYKRWMWIAEGFDVYDRKSNEPVPIPARVVENTEVVRWLDDSSLLLMQQSGRRWINFPTYILNVKTGRISTSRNYICHAYEPGKVIVLTPDATFAIESIDEMETILPEDVPEKK